jgi:hypothetical protein
MKRLLIIGAIAAILATACEIHPYADFVVDDRYVQPYESVRFTNVSENASSYHWDFGDGAVTNVPNPNHIYSREGVYTVTLTVHSRDGNVDKAMLEVEVFYDVELEITVAEWNDDEIIEFIVPGAFVVLYETLDDWYFDENPVVWGDADDDGVIGFIGLRPQRYWVWVEADDIADPGDHYDNEDFYNYFPEDYLATYPLVQFSFNTWIAWADYYFPPPKSTEKRKDKYKNKILKRNERSFIIVDVSK